MSRNLSTLAKQAIYAQETGEVFLLLLTISGSGLTTIRVVNNTQDVVSGGNTYLGFPFDITLADEDELRPPRMRLRIDNVDRQIVQALRSLTVTPTIQLDVVLASQPNTIEASFPGFTLRDASYDALVVEGDLLLEDVLNEPFPQHAFTPQHFPAVF
jgi:hypothetical protein